MRVIKYILGISFLVLILHAVMIIVTERANQSRWAMTEAGQAYVKGLFADSEYDYAGGGEAANSALVLNLNGDELPATTEAYQSEVYFDHDGRGIAIQSGWIGPGSGFLLLLTPGHILDPSGRDLFGNHSDIECNQEDFVTDLAKGFAALRCLDFDQNGRIDDADLIWPKLQVWLDKNSDGLIDPGELFSLDELQIASLNLDIKKEEFFLTDHNYLAASASFSYSDGRRGRLDEVYFQQISANRRALGSGELWDSESVDFVPEIQGSGVMPNLRSTASRNEELRSLIQAFLDAGSHEDKASLVDSILAAWAFGSDMDQDLAARAARSSYRLRTNCLDHLTQAQKQYLVVLGAWGGRNLYRLPNESYPGQEPDLKVKSSGPDGLDLDIICPKELWQQSLPKAYAQLKSDVFFELMRFSHLKPYLELVDYAPDGSATGADRLMEYFDGYFEADSRRAAFDLIETRIVLAKDKIPSRQLPGFDVYIAEKLWNMVLDDELQGLQRYMLKSIQVADRIDLKKRMDEQWGRTGKSK